MDFPELTLHRDLQAAMSLVYGPAALECTKLHVEKESADYGAYRLELAGLSLLFRASKITPTKVGQFVTLWKRIGNGPIQPFDASDPIDFFVVSCRMDARLGQFIFPRSVLCDRDIVGRNGKGGRRAMRIYPPWDLPTSRQAQQTQNWQLRHFLETSEGQAADLARARMLFGLEPVST